MLADVDGDQLAAVAAELGAEAVSADVADQALAVQDLVTWRPFA